MPAKVVHPEVFPRLCGVLRPFATGCDIQSDTPDNFTLVAKCAMPRKGPVWFASIQRKKNYVTFHLMPLYMNAAMQKRVSPALKKRMQGKACFNFTEVDENLFADLAELVRTAAAGYPAWLEAARSQRK
jgi:hypothetical protein